MTSKKLAEKIAQLALSKKGRDVLIMDLRKVSDMADFFVIVSGESDIHVKTLCNFVETELRNEKIHVWHKEGFSKLNWVLMDYVEVIVHIFRPETRAYYNLEKLWADAPTIRVKDDVDDRILPERTA